MITFTYFLQFIKKFSVIIDSLKIIKKVEENVLTSKTGDLVGSGKSLMYLTEFYELKSHELKEGVLDGDFGSKLLTGKFAKLSLWFIKD